MAVRPLIQILLVGRLGQRPPGEFEKRGLQVDFLLPQALQGMAGRHEPGGERGWVGGSVGEREAALAGTNLDALRFRAAAVAAAAPPPGVGVR